MTAETTLLPSDLGDFPTDDVCYGAGPLGKFSRVCLNKPRVRLIVSEDGEPAVSWVTQYCPSCFGLYVGESLAQAEFNVRRIRGEQR